MNIENEHILQVDMLWVASKPARPGTRANATRVRSMHKASLPYVTKHTVNTDNSTWKKWSIQGHIAIVFTHANLQSRPWQHAHLGTCETQRNNHWHIRTLPPQVDDVEKKCPAAGGNLQRRQWQFCMYDQTRGASWIGIWTWYPSSAGQISQWWS